MKTLLRTLHAPVYERRLQVLVELIGQRLPAGESLLDIGCGAGTLGSALAREHGIEVRGLETNVREGCAIPVDPYDGKTIPFEDDSLDNVLLADVLHHEENPGRLLREAGRVARKRVIVKDHKTGSFLAWPRIAFLDWGANAGYGVRCLFRYPSQAGWHELFGQCGLGVEEERISLNLYPPFLNLIFGKRLQYFAVLSPTRQKSK